MDASEEEGGVPSWSLKTEAGDGRQQGTPWRMFASSLGDRLAYADRIFELNRCRSSYSSTRLSFTRGARIETVPDPTVSLRSRAWPLRTTSRLPSSSR